MSKARIVKQISFIMPNRAGLLSEITTALSGAKVNITAICAYEMENNAYFMLLTSSNAKAKKALSPLGVDVKEENVVSVEMPNKVGVLKKAADKIADAGININYMYGTASGAKASICIFKTKDDKKTVKVFNKK